MSHTTERRRAPRTAATPSIAQRRDRRQSAAVQSDRADPADRQRALLVRGTAGMAPAMLADAGMRHADLSR